jgi:heptaprenyl diphosphate synthase
MTNLGLPEINKELEESLASEMQLVEDHLRTAIEGDYPYAVETSRHLIDAGGKRIRPLLTLLAAHFGSDREINLQKIIKAAIVCELTHVATLYHDDVMDEAPRRRGVDSANAKWGNNIAILTGDYIFAKTSLILADLGPEAVRLQAKTFERLVIGQINETKGSSGGEVNLDYYLKVIADKTASLLSASARFGALFSGASSEVIETLSRYGEEMGLVFQLADDILDIQSSSSESGKTQGTDLKEGVPTLVTLLILDGTVPASDDLKTRLSAPINDESVLSSTLLELRTHPALRAAEEIVDSKAKYAISLLNSLPNGVAKEALINLTQSVINRSA